MNSIDSNVADRLSLALFDDIVIPSAEAMRATGHDGYFARARDVKALTYFGPPSMPIMQSADFDFPGGGNATGLIDVAAQHWIAEGEEHLACMCPGMRKIARALEEEAAVSTGDVDIMCYTMF
ncbi:MAG TPA: hypothetical protein P5307_26375 [Pirellulaceae bacterium]|nr:hypothetical protein [Pirellulaceae bacterium]